eukprot:symbB.v1.2.004151.t1/scaffold235.1/size321457/10
MPGQARSHVVGVLHKTSFCSCNVQSITGQSMMFWFDQVVLVGVLFYADVASDLKQLKLFYDQGVVDYMAFNALGLLIPPVVTMLEAFEWSKTPSPELSFFQRAKDAEAAESTISALVQTNFLVSLLAKVDAIAKLALTDEQLQSMAISVAISCLSAGLSFAGRDKSDGMVLSLPGKVGWGPTMGCLVLVRAMEVASRILAFNIIQVSMRGGKACGRSRVRDSASGADLGALLTASVVAFLDASQHTCTGCQRATSVTMRTHRAWMPSDAKELPPKYLVGWLLAGVGSSLFSANYGQNGPRHRGIREVHSLPPLPGFVQPRRLPIEPVHEPSEEVKLQTAKSAAMQQLQNLKRSPCLELRRKGFKDLLRTWHPDKNPENLKVAVEVFLLIQDYRGLLLQK